MFLMDMPWETRKDIGGFEIGDGRSSEASKRQG